MKKKGFLILFVFIVLCILPLCCIISAKEIDSRSVKPALFPLSLERIEDEAFEGTAFVTVVFPEGLVGIGSRAFDNIQTLKDVYIPETTTYMADSAFLVTPGLTLHGIDESYAKDWACRHEIPFIIEDVWNVIVQWNKSQKAKNDPTNRIVVMIALIILLKLFRLSYYELRSGRPQDRPELNPIDYRFP